MEEKLEIIFKKLHFVPSLIGYTYLKEAIILKFNKDYKLQEIYKILAEKHNTTSTAIERVLRHLYSNNKEFIKKYYNYPSKITNSVLVGLILRELNENDIEINPLDFEEIVKHIDKNKYHINRALRFDKNNKPYLAEWSIFRKDMSAEEYFDATNLAILSSKNGNTLDDIKKLVEEF